jgi:hypothetical protein
MKSILRALALTGIVGFGAATGAQAQARVYVGIGAPVVAAIPPCPGDGYVWTAGYYEGRAWVPGRWIYRGYDRGYYRARVGWDHRYYNDHDRRGFDRDHYRDHDHR